MKNDYIFKPFVKRLHAFSAMLIMMLCFSAPAQSKETAVAYLTKTVIDTYYTLIFDYKDTSGTDYGDKGWTGSKVLDSGETPPWEKYAESIGQVIFYSSFKSQTPKSMKKWFNGCTNLTTIKGINYLNTSKVVDMSSAFDGCEKLTELNLSTFDTSSLELVRYMFYGCSALKSINILGFKTSKIKSYDYMFYGCKSLTSLSSNTFDLANTVNQPNGYSQVDGMFGKCSSLKSIDLSKFKNTSKLTSLRYMFWGCERLEQLVFPDNFDTSNVTDMGGMFWDCTKLTHIGWGKAFDTSKVTNMVAMFDGCQSLQKLDLTHFNTANVTLMEGMFQNMTSLEKLFISSFNTSNVTDMRHMFSDCTSLKKLDLHNFSINNKVYLNSMFNGCTALTTIYCSSKWNTSGQSSLMFYKCPNLVGAISYDPDKNDVTYANPTTGYFTKIENIGVKICGERVTNANCDDLSYIEGVGILVKETDGHIYFNNRNLYLKDVIMETVDESCIEVTDGLGLKICVEGDVRLFERCTSQSKIKPVISLMGDKMHDNYIYTPIDAEPGSMLVDGHSSNVMVPAIVSTGPLRVDCTEIHAIGSYGICGGTDGIGPLSSLTIGEDTKVSATGYEGGSICNFNDIINWGMVTYPKGAYDDGHAVVLNGQIVKDMVVIGKAVYGYGIFIAGQEVNSANCDDLSVINGVTVGDDGYLRFNFPTKTLEMENVVIAGGENYALRNTFKNLKIKVGHGGFFDYNLLSSDVSALYIDAPTTIVGNGGVFKDMDGCLMAYSNNGTAIRIGESGELTIEDASVVGSGKIGIDGITTGSKLKIWGLAQVGGYGSDYSIGNLYQLSLGDHIKIISPYGAKFSDSFVRYSNGSVVKGENVIISYYNPADVNLDGEVNISDVVAVINTIAGDETFKSTADVNSDKNVDISDVVAIINVMAGGEIPLPKPQD